jgi:hypothetical protein
MSDPRHVHLVDRPDPTAPEGSAAWALYYGPELALLWHNATTDLADLRGYLQTFAEHHGYRHLTAADGQPFASFQAWCLAPPPHGLGYEPRLLEAVQMALRQFILGESPTADDIP